MSNRRCLLAMLGIGVMLAAAACSGSDGGGDAANATPTAAATVVPSLAADATPRATAAPMATFVFTATPRPPSTVVAPTVTPVATATPRPTATPVPAATATPVPTATPPPTATPVPVFLPGVYYRAQNVSNAGGSLAMLGGGVPAIAMNPGGFSVRADMVVFPSGGDRLTIIAPNGSSRTVQARGLYQLARPSLSPDGRSAAVQASEDAGVQPGSLNIYVVDMANGTWRRISNRPVNEESPEWFARSNRIAYSSFSPAEGVNLHVYDLDAQREVLTALDGGGIHLAVSPDERTILEPGRMRLYDAATGVQTADLRAAAIAGVRGAGFELDTRYPGQANRGTYPLDGTFSPDGRTIVFDGAVRRGSDYGIIIAQMSVTGTDFRMLTDLVTVNPAFSNNNNYSQLNPTWLGPA